MVEFEQGTEVLVKGIIHRVFPDGRLKYKIWANGFTYNSCLDDLIPASALDVSNELFEALEALLSKVGCGSALSCPICEQARAALKKARGEQ